jgi:SAM-dependent methyltransferase
LRSILDFACYRGEIMATALELLSEAHRKGLRAEHMRFRADGDRLEIQDAVLQQGDDIKRALRLLNLRRNRAETLTRRIHLFYCALAAARIHRRDGWISVHEIGQLEGWAGASVAKLLINEFELGAGAPGIFEQKGRGAEAQLRLRMPPGLVELGELPAGVRHLVQERRSQAAPLEDVLPRSVRSWDFAVEVAGALRAARRDRTLLVSPLYQAGGSETGNHSLVFGGLEVRPFGATPGRPPATTVLMKLPLGLNASKAPAIHQEALDAESQLLAELAGWPGLPTRIERVDLDLRFDARALKELEDKHGIHVRDQALAMTAMIIPLGFPRTVEAEPRLLRGVIDGTAAPARRLTRRDIHNVVLVAERLATLTRLLHRRRRAHRHLSVDAIVLRYELGIIEDVLAADLAASVEVPEGSDELLFRDLFDLGRVLAHLITGWRLSEARQDFEPPFPGRDNLKNAVAGEGETVARLLFAVSRYLLEASPGERSGERGDPATVGLLDQFLYEVQHINTLHWSRARGVPERRVSSRGAASSAFAGDALPREEWQRSAADPVATRLVTISHLVDPLTLQRWCERYITSFAWHESMPGPGELIGGEAPPVPSARRCIAILQRGFGRSAAREMWTYLWNASSDEPLEDQVRVLRNYVTHWTRERRFDVRHPLGEDAQGAPILSDGLRDELDRLAHKLTGRPGPEAELLAGWIDELKRRTRSVDELEPSAEGAGDPARRVARSAGDERLRSWMHAGALMRLLRTQAAPTEKDIYDVEIALRGRSSPETVFWHILLARAWVTAAARGDEAEGKEESGWDKAMRTLLVAAGVAASRKLPFEMAATLSASAHLTRIALAAPDLRNEVISRGADEDSVRVQAAECALAAADAHLWLDNQKRHCRSILEAAWLLLGCVFPERLIHALKLLALARNNRLLDWQPPQIRDDPRSPAGGRFERYRSQGGAPEIDDAKDERGAGARPVLKRFTRLERQLFDEAQRSWTRARRRARPDDPGAALALGAFAFHAPGIDDFLEAGVPPSELGGGGLIELALRHHGEPSARRVLDLGCGTGDEAQRLARTGQHEVWAVDSPAWFAVASRGASAPGTAEPGLELIALDPMDYASRIHDGTPPSNSPAMVDVVLLRGSLGRFSQRELLLSAAHKLLRPGGLVVSVDWVQTRTTDRITWSRLVETMGRIDVETARGLELLCEDTGFAGFHVWDARDVASALDPTAPGIAATEELGVQRFLQRRFGATARKLDDERSDAQRSPHERAFLLRAKRDLEALIAMTEPRGPFDWLIWSARRP